MIGYEVRKAIDWALEQKMEFEGESYPVEVNGVIDEHLLVYFVREYFNNNNINYETFSFENIKPYL